MSMGTIGARHAHQIIKNARNVLAIEALCAMTGCGYRGVDQMAPKTKRQFDELAALVNPIDEDRIFTPDIEKIAAYLNV